MPRIPLPTQSAPARSGYVTGERVVNGFAEPPAAEAKSSIAVYGVPGLKSFAEPSEAPFRGGIVLTGTSPSDDVVYSVHEQGVFKTVAAGTSTAVGTCPGAGRCIIARNANATTQIAIVSEGLVTILQGDATSLLVADALEGLSPNSVEFLDGYLIFTVPDGRFFITAINDADSIDALDFATAEGDPDGLLRVIKYRRELYFFGPKSTEVWSNSGAAAFPFERLAGAVLNVGIIGSHAAFELGERLYFVDQVGVVRTVSGGYSSQRISTRGVESAIENLASPAEVALWGYQAEGHEFLVVEASTFTWVFDATTGLWHERESWQVGRWRATGYLRAFGKHLVGVTTGGQLYEVDEDTHDEDGAPIVITCRTPPVDAFPAGARIWALDVDVETGVGVVTGASEDMAPELMLRLSRDGGRTWEEGRRRPLGALGKARTRVRFPKLGRIGRQGVQLELSCSAAVVKTFVGLSIEVDKVNG